MRKRQQRRIMNQIYHYKQQSVLYAQRNQESRKTSHNVSSPIAKLANPNARPSSSSSLRKPPQNSQPLVRNLANVPPRGERKKKKRREYSPPSPLGIHRLVDTIRAIEISVNQAGKRSRCRPRSL